MFNAMGQVVTRSLISVARFHFSTVREGFGVGGVALGWVFYLVLQHPNNLILFFGMTDKVRIYGSIVALSRNVYTSWASLIS